MTENNEQGELIPSGKDIVPPPAEPIRLEEARARLQIVVSTSENSVIPSDQIAGLSREQISEAVSAVGEDLMSKTSKYSADPWGERGMVLDAYRHIFRGMRWVFANMLTWGKSKIILPEELNRNLLLK